MLVSNLMGELKLYSILVFFQLVVFSFNVNCGI